MQNIKKYILIQNINNIKIKNIVYCTYDDYISLKKFLLPNGVYEKCVFFKMQVRSKDNMKSYFSFAISSKFNEKDVYNFFMGKYYNFFINNIVIFYFTYDVNSYIDFKKSSENGFLYEKYIYNLLLNRGYNVIHNCMNLGFKDKGLDFVAIKNNVAFFIQCKNYDNTLITHLHLKEFYANCELYFLKNDFSNYKVRYLFLSSKNNLDKSAKFYLNDNFKVEFFVVSFS